MLKKYKCYFLHHIQVTRPGDHPGGRERRLASMPELPDHNGQSTSVLRQP